MKSSFYSARQLAKAAGVSAKTIHRRAAAEHWPSQKDRKRFRYSPPPGFAKVAMIASAQREEGGLSDRIISEPETRRLARANFRLAAIIELQRQLAAGAGREKALRDTAHRFSFKISPSALRRWAADFQRAGFDGLAEHKQGIVGRKPSKGRKGLLTQPRLRDKLELERGLRRLQKLRRARELNREDYAALKAGRSTPHLRAMLKALRK